MDKWKTNDYKFSLHKNTIHNIVEEGLLHIIATIASEYEPSHKIGHEACIHFCFYPKIFTFDGHEAARSHCIAVLKLLREPIMLKFMRFSDKHHVI